MQCLWSPRIASVVGTARCSASRRAAVITGPPCSKHITSRPLSAPRRRTTIGAYLNVTYHRTLSTQAALEPASSPHTHTAPPDTACNLPSPPTASSAHASRMAAQSIRLCVAQKAFGDAFYIFHAVKYSNDPAFDASAQDLSGYGRDLPRYADVALQFGQTVNPRLAAHALLHSLLRAGQPELAYRFSIKMMEAGVEFHHRSLEGVIKFLSPLPNESPVRHYVRSMVRQYNPTRPLCGLEDGAGHTGAGQRHACPGGD
ncbi:uncharacterized protein SCHCODRAFT_02673938 [Schizophyllum commune H4-8]|uniref:uncharacterized protein n=1 Tax=Schizophyllum commune (strain H4-8 / FGSC 9210) TaxID=578458 RepID=UPI0021610A96|nr:uncharacterized protein SCHCODRAFT_02673938 [Schizophyllum commune H4-8]KAI5884937.1 hypothetical protein SCHCODRAFT_02673938 [Schizophyllum commune H4-8]